MNAHTYTVALHDPRGATRYRNDGAANPAMAAKETARCHMLVPNTRMWVAEGTVQPHEEAEYAEYVVGADCTVVWTNRKEHVAAQDRRSAAAALRQALAANADRLAEIEEKKHLLDNEAARLKERVQLARTGVNIALGEAMTPELLDLLLPQHGRTSCSDADLANGFMSNGHGSPPRCNRCAMLQLMSGAAAPDDVTVTLNIDTQAER